MGGAHQVALLYQQSADHWKERIKMINAIEKWDEREVESGDRAINVVWGSNSGSFQARAST